MQSRLLFLITLVCISMLGSELRAQRGPDRSSHIRERWDSMSESERALFKERMESLRKMSAEERQALKDRADQLEERRADEFERLDQEAKRRLATLDPERRDQLLREYFSDCERVRGVRLREQLPPDFLERMEGGHPDERRSMMRKFHKEMRGQASDRMLHHLRHEMDAPPEVLEQVADLPKHARRQAMLEFKRDHIRSRVAVEGPPPGVSQDEWAALDQLPLDEFFRSFGLRRDEERRRGKGGPKRMGPDGGPDPRGPEGGRGRFGRGPHGPRPEFGPPREDGEDAKAVSPELRELSRLAHPDFEDLLESMQLPNHERRAAVSALVRTRSLEFLDANDVIEAVELERLRALQPIDFVHEIRRFLGRSRGHQWTPSERGNGDKPRRRRRH
ncbi:MAG: hypothetical protein ACI8TQ_003639 [Planctomycetota bacterium]|jgi:hypothetical protein